MKHRNRIGAALAATALLAACGGSPAPQAPGALPPPPDSSDILTVTETADRYTITDGIRTVALARDAWQLSLTAGNGQSCLSEAAAQAPDPRMNPDFDLYNDRGDGIDAAYPGLPQVSYAPLGYLASQWQTVTGVRAVDTTGRTATVQVATSDGQGATVQLVFAGDGALELRFTPAADGVSAVSESFEAAAAEAYFGGGQRFHGLNQRGKSLPLWISHGGTSDRYYSTNEIAASFFWSPSGWGVWANSDARGEINFAVPTERPDAVSLVLEDDHLDLVLYCGTPQQILSTHTARAGRPAWTPPDWMWTPMVWQDSDTSTESVRKLVDGMLDRNIPLGAVWLDNPWDAGKATFDFDPERFEAPDALIREVHDKGVRFMVWLSPFVTNPLFDLASDQGWLVTGTRPDNNDATYYPPRSIDPHLDFTNPAAEAWWRERLETLIARGVDGVKVDRGEEDLSDESVWANGLPNRLNHNAYVGRYHRAIFDAFHAQRPDDDFVILARGGWNGSAQWSGHWAADNTSGPGILGLGQALNSLLTLSVSGFPFNGSDVGGYAGTRQDAGEAAFNDPTQIPTVNTYLRWTQLGALSPVMQTPIPPWWVSDAAIANYRRYAELHQRLVPYTARWAAVAIEQGIPIVRPMAYAFADDPLATAIEDQYLYGPDLLVAPITGPELEAGSVTRSVYIPAGRWTDFWTGQAYDGPLTVPYLAMPDILPLFVRDGAELPANVSADQIP